MYLHDKGSNIEYSGGRAFYASSGLLNIYLIYCVVIISSLYICRFSEPTLIRNVKRPIVK